MYVIKNKFGEYVNRNKIDSKKLDYIDEICGIEFAEHYSINDIAIIKERFKATWRYDVFKIYEIITYLKALEDI